MEDGCLQPSNIVGHSTWSHLGRSTGKHLGYLGETWRLLTYGCPLVFGAPCAMPMTDVASILRHDSYMKTVKLMVKSSV